MDQDRRIDPTDLETSRLRFREFAPGDCVKLQTFKDDPSQLRLMMFSLATDQEIASFLEWAMAQAEAAERLEYHFALEEKATGEFVGGVALMKERESPTTAELGYWFARKHWGKGYATEAALKMIGFGFRSAKLHRIWGQCHVENKASARVMEKCGMSFEGTIREHVRFRDHYRSSRQYSMLEQEYGADCPGGAAT